MPRMRWPLAALAELARDPAENAEERQAFEEYTRAATERYWPWLGFGIAAAALLWWPLDAVVFAGHPRIQFVYAVFRLIVIVVDLSLSWALPRVAFCRRHAHGCALLAAVVNLCLTGYVLAEAGQGSALFVSYTYVVPLFAVLLIFPLGARTLATFLFSASVFGAWLAHPMSSLATPEARAVPSFLVFCSLLAIGTGHGSYVLLRHDFHLRRRVERQRAELEGLTLHLEERVADQTRALRQMHERASALRVELRQELARDLHDGLGQELTSLNLLVGVGRAVMREPSQQELLDELGGQVSRVQQSLRRALEALRPVMLEEHDLVEALRLMARDLERRSGLRIRCEIAEDVPVPLPAPVAVALFRIASEGLHNALRHGRARHITVSLRAEGPAVVLGVRDDGVGIDLDRLGAGLGTRSVRERAEALGGAASWTVDGGTVLSVRIPLGED